MTGVMYYNNMCDMSASLDGRPAKLINFEVIA